MGDRPILGESLNVCIPARIPVPQIKLTFVNVLMSTVVCNSRLDDGRNSAAYGNVLGVPVLALYLLEQGKSGRLTGKGKSGR